MTPSAALSESDIKIETIKKLIIIFGLLIAVVLVGESVFAIRSTRKVVTDRIQTHLTDKAVDVAEIIDGRITAWFQLIEMLRSGHYCKTLL